MVTLSLELETQISCLVAKLGKDFLKLMLSPALWCSPHLIIHPHWANIRPKVDFDGIPTLKHQYYNINITLWAFIYRAKREGKKKAYWKHVLKSVFIQQMGFQINHTFWDAFTLFALCRWRSPFVCGMGWGGVGEWGAIPLGDIKHYESSWCSEMWALPRGPLHNPRRRRTTTPEILH